LRLLRWTLCIIGTFALLLAAMVATPLAQPPELRSISETARAVDRSTMPGLERFSARDGTALAYRHYRARSVAVGRIAILVHGYREDLAATKPITLISGADDELMLADEYADALHAVAPSADVKLIPGVNHMGIVSVSKAVSAIADDVATHGIAGS
jgi:hypothetical protein